MDLRPPRQPHFGLEPPLLLALAAVVIIEVLVAVAAAHAPVPESISALEPGRFSVTVLLDPHWAREGTVALHPPTVRVGRAQPVSVPARRLIAPPSSASRSRGDELGDRAGFGWTGAIDRALTSLSGPSGYMAALHELDGSGSRSVLGSLSPAGRARIPMVVPVSTGRGGRTGRVASMGPFEVARHTATELGHEPNRGPGEPRMDAAPDPEKLSADEIEELIRANHFAIRRCYDGVVSAEQELSGKIVISAVVESRRARGVDVIEDALFRVGVSDCLRRQVLTWEFPVRARPYSVSLPFILAGRSPGE